MRKIGKRLLVGMLLLCFWISSPVLGAESEVTVQAKGAVLLDGMTGRVLWRKNGQEPLAVASTTKVLTALIVLESGQTDQEATVSARAAAAPKVHLGLKSGERYRVGDLLYPLLLESSNDAAVVLAEQVGGSVENFAAKMNAKAKALGAKDSYFVTPNGLDQDGNHATAEDMARILAAAVKREDFCQIAQTENFTLTQTNGTRQFSVQNKNRLLTSYEGMIAGKTGYTGLAGQCFVGAAQRGGRRLVVAVLGCGYGKAGQEQKWKDAQALLDYGFETFSLQPVIQKRIDLPLVVVKKGQQSFAELMYENPTILMKPGEAAAFTYDIELQREWTAPLPAGTTVGIIHVKDESGQPVSVIPIYTSRAVPHRTWLWAFYQVGCWWLNGGMAAKQGK